MLVQHGLRVVEDGLDLLRPVEKVRMQLQVVVCMPQCLHATEFACHRVWMLQTGRHNKTSPPPLTFTTILHSILASSRYLTKVINSITTLNTPHYHIIPQHPITPHHTTPHHTTLHHTTLHQTTPYYTTPHHTTPHHITPHHTTPHHTTPHHTTPHHSTLHHRTLHHSTPH